MHYFFALFSKFFCPFFPCLRGFFNIGLLILGKVKFKEIGMCQVKVGNNLQNCHNAQNQIKQSVKGLVREMFLSHFKLGETVIFLENS